MSGVFWTAYFERLLVVAVVLIVLAFVARKLRESRFFARRGRRLNVIESIALSPNAALHIVRAGTRCFLIGSGGVRRLAEIEEGFEPDTPRPHAPKR